VTRTPSPPQIASLVGATGDSPIELTREYGSSTRPSHSGTAEICLESAGWSGISTERDAWTRAHLRHKGDANATRRQDNNGDGVNLADLGV
jgi:hypothetical protein